jgi:hypothetical protein
MDKNIMRYSNIIFKIVTLICFLVMIPFSYKVAEESELIYSMYNPMRDEIAQQECYNTFEERLKIDMEKVGAEIDFHSLRSYKYWMLVQGVGVFIFLLALVLTILEIRKGK